MTNSDKNKIAYLALGGNVGNVEKTFSKVANKLAQSHSVQSLRFSKLYQTAPWGVEDQDDFLNLVVEVEWSDSLDNLADLCFLLEKEFGRDREKEVRWGPRIIDIDILLFGDTINPDEKLQVPHPRMHQRRFVLKPFVDLAASLVMPGTQKTMVEILNECEDEGKVFPVHVVLWKPNL